MRRFLTTLIAGSLLLLAPELASAGKVSSLSVNPNPATKNQPITISVGHGGSKCGFRVSTGVGAPLGPYLLKNAGKNLSFTYPQAGTFSVVVTGKKKGNNPKCNLGAGVQPISVVVQSGGNRSMPPSVLQQAPGGGKPPAVITSDQLKIKQKKPKIKIPKKPKLRPRIESVLFVQGPVGVVAPAVLAPGGRLFIKGKRFGSSKGRLFLKVSPSDFPQYPSGEIDLTDLKWADEKVNGKIPSGMTAPLHRANVKVTLRKSTSSTSNDFPRQFEIPVETRILKRSDQEVRLVYCAEFATYNRCLQDDASTLNGWHKNVWGVPGNVASDDYAIYLQNGWVFSRVSRFTKKVTGNDGDYVKPLEPALPIGKSSWAGEVKWKATSDDEIGYQIDIEVMRAKGAY